MNAFTALVTLSNVLLDVDAPDTKSLFWAVAKTWQRELGVDPAAIVARLLAREKLGSTGLGKGVAIPHARIAGLERALGAVVRPRTPLPFGTPDDQPVHLFFVLLVPAVATQRHLQILADAAAMLDDTQFRASVLTCPGADAVCNLMALWKPGRSAVAA